MEATKEKVRGACLQGLKNATDSVESFDTTGVLILSFDDIGALRNVTESGIMPPFAIVAALDFVKHSILHEHMEDGL